MPALRWAPVCIAEIGAIQPGSPAGSDLEDGACGAGPSEARTAALSLEGARRAWLPWPHSSAGAAKQGSDRICRSNRFPDRSLGGERSGLPALALRARHARNRLLTGRARMAHGEALVP